MHLWQNEVTPEEIRQAITTLQRIQYNILDKKLVRGEKSRIKLSRQEVQVYKLSFEGLSQKEIAARLFVSVSAVKHARQHIYKKLKVHSCRQMIGKLYTEQI